MLSEDNVNRQDTGELSSRKQSMFEGEAYIYIWTQHLYASSGCRLHFVAVIVATPDLTAIALGEVRTELSKLSNVHTVLTQLEATLRQLLLEADAKEHETRKRPATEDKEEHQQLKAFYQTLPNKAAVHNYTITWVDLGSFGFIFSGRESCWASRRQS